MPGNRSVSVAGPPRGALRLARVMGVPIYLSASWLLIAVFITVTFADVFRDGVRGSVSAPAAYLLAAAFAVLSVLSVLAHELGHVVVALRLGLQVRQVYLFLLGGVSEISPDPRTAGAEFAVSAAGPAVSAALAAVSWILGRLVDRHSALGVELDLMLYSNLVIAVFNALPGLPLDGGRVLRALVWGAGSSRSAATTAAAWAGRVLALGVAGFGVLMPRHGWEFGASVLTVVLAIFLWTGASQSLTTARLGQRVPELSVAALVRRAVWLPATTPLAQAIDAMLAHQARAMVVTDTAGRPIAIAAEARVRSVPPVATAWTTLGEVATTASLEHALPITLTGADLLRACQAEPATEYFVLGVDGRPVGVLVAADIRAALSTAR